MAVISIIMVTIFAGIRGYVGTDTYSYHMMFRNAEEESLLNLVWSTEVLFAVFIKLITFATSNSFIFLALIAALQGVILIKLINRTKHPAEFMALYISLFYLNFQFNILRGGTAILLLILASKLFYEKNARPFYLVGLVAVTTHYSAIIGLFPMLLNKGEGFLRKVLIFAFSIMAGFGLYMLIVNSSVLSGKYLFLLASISSSEVVPYGLGLFAKILIYIIIFACVVNRVNRFTLTPVFIVLISLMIATIRFSVVDRIEVIVNALFVFWALEVDSAGIKREIRNISIVALVALGLYSSIFKIAMTSDKDMARGAILLDEAHARSPFNPYRFFWEEK
ncbi:EpsG family protein [Geothrix campi]|uniref:EpsG family protein n=1 Tax=Geothrix campi TaxID=2966450 RepID=UPI002148F0CA